MKVSMNGFRKNLSGDVEKLRELIKEVINDENWYDKQDLVDAMNQVIIHSNVLNCIFVEGDEDFSDLSHIELELLEEE